MLRAFALAGWRRWLRVYFDGWRVGLTLVGGAHATDYKKLLLQKYADATKNDKK